MSQQKPRVLAVDDEARYIRAIQINMEARGFEVIAAQDGREAIELVARESPDIVLLDVRMPDVDGYEACQRIREFSTVPIIMLTAMAEEENKIRGLEIGADDYITKPFSAEELVARVQATLRRAALSNPFSDEREELDFRIGECEPGTSITERLDCVYTKVKERVARLEKQGKADAGLYTGEDKIMMQSSFLFEIFFLMSSLVGHESKADVAS